MTMWKPFYDASNIQYTVGSQTVRTVRELARLTRSCPDSQSQIALNRIISTALRSYTSIRHRKAVLERRTQGTLERKETEGRKSYTGGVNPNFKFDSHVVWGLWGGDTGPQSE